MPIHLVGFNSHVVLGPFFCITSRSFCSRSWLSVLTSLMDLKTQKAYENVLPRGREMGDSSLLRYQGVPAGGVRRGHLASPYLTHEDSFKRRISVGRSEGEVRVMFSSSPCWGWYSAVIWLCRELQVQGFACRCELFPSTPRASPFIH